LGDVTWLSVEDKEVLGVERMGLKDRRGHRAEIMELKVALLAGESHASTIFLAPHASEWERKVHLD